MGSSVVKVICGMVMVVLCVFSGPCDSLAASPPDAGAILRDIRDKPALPPSGEAGGTTEIRPEAVVKPMVAGPKVFVKGFRIKGAVIFTEETLLPILQEYLGKEHEFSELQKAAEKITAYYAAQGYIVRAYLPPQEIRDGIVEIAVIEGRLEEILPDKESKSRLDFQRAKHYISASQRIGEPIRITAIERGMLILNDVPGVAASAALQPGTKEGMVLSVVKLSGTPLITGNLDVDNAGSRASGEYRVGAVVNLNNPAGIGDGLSVKALGGIDDRYTLRTKYGRIAYNLPAGYSGLRLGASFAAMDYTLGAEFSDANAKGRAAIYGLFASYPLLRQREHNLSVIAQYDRKNLYNEALGAATSDKRVDAATLGLSGNIFDSLMGGGYTSLGVSFVMGRLDLSGCQNDLIDDQLTARSHGEYKKATLSLYRMQRLADETTFSLNITHQIAFNNLDTSEEISLGGAYGVRAYPANEASGDEGTLVAAELRQRLTQNISVFGFYDYGRIKTNHTEWAATARLNSYDLQGAGGGIAYIKPGNFHVTCTVANRLGNNSGSDTSGNDSDGTKRSPRIWVTASKYF